MNRIDGAHYDAEQTYWDERGQEQYLSLSDYDLNRLKKWIGWRGNGSVLDIGGGSGMLSRHLVASPNTSCVCLDISFSMLRHSPVNSIQADALSLPFEASSFDLVIAAALFHHLPGLEAEIFRECCRVLRSGGRLIGYDPSAWCVQNRLFMSKGSLRLKIFSPDELPIDPERFGETALEEEFEEYRFETFSFRNSKLTFFEFIQRFLLNPVAVGPFKRICDRWFLWGVRRK